MLSAGRGTRIPRCLVDLLLFLLPALAFGTLVTAHLRLVVGLSSEGLWLRALLALVVPVLAPVWGWRLRLRAWATAWGVALVTYAVTLLLAIRA